MELNTNQPKSERDFERVSFVFWFGLFLVLVGIDQLTKYLAFHTSFGSFLNALKPAVRKFHYFNHNFAFSLPLPPWLMYILYAAILGLIIWYIAKSFRRLSALAWTAWILILAGALSNIGERMSLGYVRDFIYIMSGIFNLADGYIIAGVAILLLSEVASDKGKI